MFCFSSSQGAIPEAIFHFEAALKADPEFLWAHRYLAQALETSGKLDQAVEHAEKAHALDPKNSSVRFPNNPFHDTMTQHYPVTMAYMTAYATPTRCPNSLCLLMLSIIVHWLTWTLKRLNARYGAPKFCRCSTGLAVPHLDIRRGWTNICGIHRGQQAY